MSSMQEDIQCAGSDTRPPMLDRTDFDLALTFTLQCTRKAIMREYIMKSINEGPLTYGKRYPDVLLEEICGAVQLVQDTKLRFKTDVLLFIDVRGITMRTIKEKPFRETIQEEMLRMVLVMDENSGCFLAREQIINFDEDVDNSPEKIGHSNMDHIFEAVM
ncbi:hypothetical protein Tco_0190038 [Tanacetum coccineum]